MKNSSALGSWIRRFLLEYLVGERNPARNTQQSYRDAVRLLMVFVAAKAHKKVDELLIADIDAEGTAEKSGNAAPPVAISVWRPSMRSPASSQNDAPNIWTGVPNSAPSSPSVRLPRQSAISKSRRSMLC
jgi:hypothetical protein